uniref:Shisa N-terminal domain-containing protein n=1 Tax=Pogona vitticeps TaxID=103695 RepID=A0A6J0SUA8_9SAUR
MGRAQAGVLLFLLLWGPGDPGAGGEMCRSWMFGINTRYGPFRCPGKKDLAFSKYCCGTCLQPYCCPWQDHRLNQTACLTSGDLEGLSFEDLAAIPTVSPVSATTPPALTTTAVRATTLAVLVEKAHRQYIWVILFVLCLASSIIVAYWLIRRCLNRRFIAEWLRRPAEDPSSLELAQVPPQPEANEKSPPRPATIEVPHGPKTAVDTEARSPGVEDLQGSCEVLPCLDKPLSGQPSHPPSGSPKIEEDYLVFSTSPNNAEGPVLELTMGAESAI